MADQQKKSAIFLVNLGSPDSTSIPDVRKYLNEFLMDERVIDAPWLIRRMIVGLFILPFRPKKSAEAYEQIWWDEGSPLIVYSQRLQKKMQEKYQIPVHLGMRYGNPSIKSELKKMQQNGVDEIILMPLYPHYAMSTFESVVEKAKDDLKKLNYKASMKIVPPFYDHNNYIDALVNSAQDFLKQDYDHILFSYHGVPERHIKKSDVTKSHCLTVENCCQIKSDAHEFCYRHQVFRTTEEFVKKAKIPAEKYTLAFQSRLGRDPWLTPFTDQTIAELAQKGIKKLLVICPAFVSDCLETIEEIGMQGKETFLENGGEEYLLIPCLNDQFVTVDAFKNLIDETMDSI